MAGNKNQNKGNHAGKAEKIDTSSRFALLEIDSDEEEQYQKQQVNDEKSNAAKNAKKKARKKKKTEKTNEVGIA